MHYLGEQTRTGKKVESIATHGGLEGGFISVQSVSFSHGFASIYIFSVKILQPENDISSGKDTSVLFFFLSSFTYYFSISGYSQLKVEQQI